VVSSFLPEILLILRQLDEHLPLGLLCETPPQLAAWPRFPTKYVLPHYALMSVDLCEALRKDKRKVITWTVNRKESMQEFEKMGVDGIISDDTEMLAKLRG
jgi:glycerophosphoryl diester phosphodiesterase